MGILRIAGDAYDLDTHILIRMYHEDTYILSISPSPSFALPLFLSLPPSPPFVLSLPLTLSAGARTPRVVCTWGMP